MTIQERIEQWKNECMTVLRERMRYHKERENVTIQERIEQWKNECVTGLRETEMILQRQNVARVDRAVGE